MTSAATNLYALIGTISGIMTALLLFRNERKVLGQLATWAPSFALFTGSALIDLAHQPAQDSIVANLEPYCLAFIVVFVATVALCCMAAVRSGASIGAVLSGVHLEILKSRAAQDIETRQLSSKSDEIDSRERRAAITAQELQEKETQLRRTEREIESAKSNVPALALDATTTFVVTQQICKMIPDYTKRLVTYTSMLGRITDEAIAKLAEEARTEEGRAQFIDDNQLRDILLGYMQLICVYFVKCVVRDDDVRVHIRVRGTDNMYYKAVAIMGVDLRVYEPDITPIPYSGSMIERASTLRRPVIKSQHLGYHYAAAHDAKWRDYITCVLDIPGGDGIPLFSMGVSYRNPEPHFDLMRFLCSVQFDEMIEKEIGRFFDIVDLAAWYELLADLTTEQTRTEGA